MTYRVEFRKARNVLQGVVKVMRGVDEIDDERIFLGDDPAGAGDVGSIVRAYRREPVRSDRREHLSPWSAFSRGQLNAAYLLDKGCVVLRRVFITRALVAINEVRSSVGSGNCQRVDRLWSADSVAVKRESEVAQSLQVIELKDANFGSFCGDQVFGELCRSRAFVAMARRMAYERLPFFTVDHRRNHASDTDELNSVVVEEVFELRTASSFGEVLQG